MTSDGCCEAPSPPLFWLLVPLAIVLAPALLPVLAGAPLLGLIPEPQQ